MAASDGILCDENTWEFSKDKIIYDSTPQKIHVKGIDQEISVFKPLKHNDLTGNNSGMFNQASFVGRTREKTVVAEMLQQLKANQEPRTRALIVQGEGNTKKRDSFGDPCRHCSRR
jgi:hypothetical protein